MRQGYVILSFVHLLNSLIEAEFIAIKLTVITVAYELIRNPTPYKYVFPDLNLEQK